MADLLRLSGSLSVAPTSGTPSGHGLESMPIDEQVSVDHARGNLHYKLVSDSPQAVALDGLSVVVIVVKASTKVTTRITSGDGSTQSIPGTFILIRTEDVPITAIDLTRQAGVETQVDVTIGILPS